MGCDIHLFVEKCLDGRWVSADTWKPYLEANPNESADDWDGDIRSRQIVPWGSEFYWHRDYALFGILAGVRGYQFDTIDQPRGLPVDVTQNVRAESDWWEADGHSHSWLTLAELMAYDWSPYQNYYHLSELEFPTKTILRLQSLGPPDDVRIVFFFDN